MLSTTAMTRPTTTVPPPLHVIVWRGGRPHVVTFLSDGVTEVAARPFDDDHSAIAYLARLSRW